MRLGRVCMPLVGLLLLAGPAWGYGDEGHQAVGAVADTLLKGKPAAAKVEALLEGISLQRAALIADQIKAWDRGEAFTLGAGHEKLGAALRDFWNANKEKGENGDQVHRAFHYTDAAVSPEKPTYIPGTIGTRDDDLVHISSFCIGVLAGTQPEQNSRRITKPVALALLAHYVGDMHQPLHVGAAYFDERGQPIAPAKGNVFYESRGGNSIELSIGGKAVGNLHRYWDIDVALAGLQLKDARFDREAVVPLVAREPENWKPAAGSLPADWPRMWADDLLPLAKEAHERLSFDVTVGSEKKFKATPKVIQGQKSYDEWAAEQARNAIHKAGWRLAYTLEQVLK